MHLTSWISASWQHLHLRSFTVVHTHDPSRYSLTLRDSPCHTRAERGWRNIREGLCDLDPRLIHWNFPSCPCPDPVNQYVSHLPVFWSDTTCPGVDQPGHPVWVESNDPLFMDTNPSISGPLFWTPSKAKDTRGMIYETESAYNYIQVLEDDGYRFLRLNEGQGIHSVYHPTLMDYKGPWEQVLVAPFFNDPPYEIARVRKAAIIGLAAGTTARQLTEVFGPIPSMA